MHETQQRPIAYEHLETVHLHRSHTLDVAVDLVKLLYDDLHTFGITIGLYGSVSREGVGRDIDLMMVNAFRLPDIKSIVNPVFKNMGYSVHEAGIYGTVYKKGDVVVDVSFLEKVYHVKQ